MNPDHTISATCYVQSKKIPDPKEEVCLEVMEEFHEEQCRYNSAASLCRDEDFRDRVLVLSKEIYDNCIANYQEQ